MNQGNGPRQVNHSFHIVAVCIGLNGTFSDRLSLATGPCLRFGANHLRLCHALEPSEGSSFGGLRAFKTQPAYNHSRSPLRTHSTLTATIHIRKMWQPVALPFQSKNIPALPDVDEIRRCTEILKERSNSKVVAVNDKIIVKFGGGIETWEGQALLYLGREVPTIPAPRLYAMYQDAEETFLVMQRIPGVLLDTIWSSLSEVEKDSIVEQLRLVFQTMRAVECPWPDFLGSLDGGSVHHYLFYDQKGSATHLGPFHDEASFVARLAENFRALVERNGSLDYKVRFYEKHLPLTLRNHRSTLTHGDLQRQNIMVARRPSDTGAIGERSFDICLIDWEKAGWLPDFWEAFCASALFDLVYWEEDWCWLVDRFLHVSAPELALMLMFDKDMR
jgi:hypothetical protein